MAVFSKIYHHVIRWASHKRAPYYLTGISIAEAAILPFPTDLLLAPMALAKPQTAWRFAFLATIGSLIGALLGYAIGYFAYETIVEPLLLRFDYIADFERIRLVFEQYGLWIIFIVALIPLPFKLFTIMSGTLGMNIPIFLLAALCGRALRYFSVAGLIRKHGVIIEQKLIKFLDKIEIILLLLIFLVVIAYFVVR